MAPSVDLSQAINVEGVGMTCRLVGGKAARVGDQNKASQSAVAENEQGNPYHAESTNEQGAIASENEQHRSSGSAYDEDMVVTQFPRLQPGGRVVINHSFLYRVRDLASDAAIRDEHLWAAWAVLIAKYCEAQDAIFGASSETSADYAGRLQDQQYIFPVRACLKDHQTVTGLVEDIRKSRVKSMLVEQNLGPTLVYPNIFSIGPHTTSLDEDWPVTNRKFPEGSALVIECRIAEAGLAIQVHVDDGIVDLRQAQRLVGQFEHVIRQFSRAGPGKELRGCAR